MDGRPVWLASVSIRDRHGNLVPSSEWRQDRRTVERLEKIARKVLWGVGDETAERYFRMPITACFHRALTAEEEAGLPLDWQDSPPIDMAGGGVETFWSKVGDPLTIQPCHNPGRVPIPREPNPDIYTIEECGKCPPCKARLEVRTG